MHTTVSLYQDLNGATETSFGDVLNPSLGAKAATACWGIFQYCSPDSGVPAANLAKLADRATVRSRRKLKI